MLAVKFYEDVKDELLRFAVVIAKHDGKWVLCKHKKRETLEFPGGHRETGDSSDLRVLRDGQNARERDGRGSVRRAVLCGNRIVWGDTQRDGENCIMRRSAGKLDVPGNSAGTFERGGKTGVRRINGHKESTQSMKICVLFVCIVLT